MFEWIFIVVALLVVGIIGYNKKLSPAARKRKQELEQKNKENKQSITHDPKG